MSMLSIKGLSKTYGNGTRALDQVDLEIPKGLFGLLGPNGAGKSSLMRTVATLQRPDSGSIYFEGIDVLAQPHEARQIMGYLPQEFGVYPNVGAETLLNHLAILKGLVKRGVRRDCVHALLLQTNLWDHRRKAVSGFSGGMRQRFGVAQALLGNPRLLIVDEPTAGLDPAERQRFLDLICEVGEQVAVIFSTHMVEDVRELCPNMAILHQGKVLLRGRPEECIQQLAGQIWWRTCERAELPKLKQQHHIISTKLRSGKVLLHAMANQAPAGFEPAEANLDDVYFSTLATYP